MEDMTISLEEMLEFIYNRCAGDITKDEIEMILDLQEESFYLLKVLLILKKMIFINKEAKTICFFFISD